MPITLRPKSQLLDTLLSSLLAGNIITDVSSISVMRQLCEGIAASQADLEYDLYSLNQLYYLTTAEGIDLDARGLDHGLARDPGQAASGTVLVTKTVLWIDDMLLPAPQVFEATLADGTQVLYRSLGDAVLEPSGRSLSGAAPGTSLTAGLNDRVTINLDGDGARTLILGAQTSGTAIAAALQAGMRALTALTPSHQSAYTSFRCDYGVTTPGLYTLRTGTAGPTSSVVVTVSPTNDGSATLKLGLAQGGQERVGMGSLSVPVICDTIGVLGNVGAGQINQLQATVAGIESVANPLIFANGREPASDDAYRQDIRAYLLSLGRGTSDAVERAVFETRGDDGQKHVMTAQVLEGAGYIQVSICDGRSLTVGAQSDVIQDVQDELDGLGQELGGWLPLGIPAGVVSALVLAVPIAVTVKIGPTPHLLRAQQAIAAALHDLLYKLPVGTPLTYALAALRIDQTVVEVVDIAFTQPLPLAANPPTSVGGGLGQKVMPASLTVSVVRA